MVHNSQVLFSLVLHPLVFVSNKDKTVSHFHIFGEFVTRSDQPVFRTLMAPGSHVKWMQYHLNAKLLVLCGNRLGFQHIKETVPPLTDSVKSLWGIKNMANDPLIQLYTSDLCLSTTVIFSSTWHLPKSSNAVCPRSLPAPLSTQKGTRVLAHDSTCFSCFVY